MYVMQGEEQLGEAGMHMPLDLCDTQFGGVVLCFKTLMKKELRTSAESVLEESATELAAYLCDACQNHYHRHMKKHALESAKQSGQPSIEWEERANAIPHLGSMEDARDEWDRLCSEERGWRNMKTVTDWYKRSPHLQWLLPHLVPIPNGRGAKTAGLPLGTGACENAHRLVEGENALPMKAGLMMNFRRDRKTAIDMDHGLKSRGKKNPSAPMSQRQRTEEVTALPAFLFLMNEHYIKTRANKGNFDKGVKLDADVSLSKCGDAKLSGTVTVDTDEYRITISTGKRGLVQCA